MSVSDPRRPRPFRTALITSMIVSGSAGALILGCTFLSDGWTVSQLSDVLTVSANAMCVVFWIAFAISLSYQAGKTQREDERAILSRARSQRR